MKFTTHTSSVAAVLFALALSPSAGIAQSILKTAGNYTVLASQAVTVAGTGFTFTGGDIGLFPAATSNITGFPPGTVSGTTLSGAAAAIIATGGANQQAEADLQVAATGLAAMAPNANYSNVDMANLGALPPGVYKWNAAATLTGALVLDAQGRNNVAWVFQFGTGLTTAVNSTVTIINAGTNGGSDDGIFWNAATGAIVIGDDNTVLGNYIAYTSVSFTGSTVLHAGGGARFLALNAAVTFAGPGMLNALGSPGGGDWTGGLTLSGAAVVATNSAPPAGNMPPVFTSPPTAAGAAGAPFNTFSVAASGVPTSFSATGLPAGLSINAATGAITGTPAAPGTFAVTLTATNANGATTSTLTIVIAPGALIAPPPYARISNFSARAVAGTGADTLIAGFYVSGNGKNLLVRGVGPALASFGIAGPLSDPVLTLSGSGVVIATNNAWQTGSAGQAQGPLIIAADTLMGAFALPGGSADAALLATVNMGSYTASVLSPNGTSGVALVEIYDDDLVPNPAARLVNVSARMNVSPGQGVLIAGLVIEGNIPQTLLIRGVGPTLSSFGVTGAMPDPQIAVMSGASLIASNAGWGNGAVPASQLSAVAAMVEAFPLPTGSADAALLVTLPPGAYTVELTSVGGTTGVALIEIYDTQ